MVSNGFDCIAKDSKPNFLIIIGYDVGLAGKSHFNKGGKFQKISGFPAWANNSIAEFSVEGLEGFINKAQKNDRSFCAVIGSIHAHHPWDLGDIEKFDQPSLDLPAHWVDTPSAREALARSRSRRRIRPPIRRL